MIDPPPHIPPDMATPEPNDDDVLDEVSLSVRVAAPIFFAGITIGAIILLAWRGLQCGV